MSSKQTRLGSRRGVPSDYDGQLGDGQLVPTVLEEDGEETRCPHCGKWYKRVTNHWGHPSVSCSHPPISQHKMNICTGMVMGDGNIDNRNNTPYLRFYSVNKTFLEWLATELGWLSSSVTLFITSANQANGDPKRGTGNWSGDPKDYYDVYEVKTVANPMFNELASWYDSGEKVYPVDLTPSPELLKMWYVSDGSLIWKRDSVNPYVQFNSRNESERPEAIQNLLDRAGFSVNHSDKEFYLSVDQTEDFLDYLGDPVPGFAYKWETESYEEHQRLKEREKEVHRTQTIE